MADLSALRVEARQKRARATRKIARLRRVNDVDITGTGYDPRRLSGKPGRYTEAQLRSYIGQLDSFLSRSTQYYRGTRGAIITKGSRDTYMRAQRRLNRYNQRQFAKIRDIALPGTSMTIDERVKQLAPRRMGSNLAANRPYDPLRRTTRSITSDRAARRLADDMVRRASPEYTAASRANNRATFNQMMDHLADEPLRRDVLDLSDKQFDVLWGYTDFVDNVAVAYDTHRGRLVSGDSNRRRIVDDSLEAAREYASWAAQLEV